MKIEKKSATTKMKKRQQNPTMSRKKEKGKSHRGSSSARERRVEGASGTK